MIVPEIEEGKEKRSEEERRKDAAFEAAQREEARPGKASRASAEASAPEGDLSPAAERRARRALVHDVERAITRDARARARAGSSKARS